MPELKLVPLRSDSSAPKLRSSDAVPVGSRCIVQGAPGIEMPQGIVGDYRISEQSGEVLAWALDEQGKGECLVWDTELESRGAEPLSIFGPDGQQLSTNTLNSNACVLETAEQEWPEFQRHTLTLAPSFEVRFTTEVCPARLGLITLVDAQRFLLLEDDSRHTLLDTSGYPSDGSSESPVLYLTEMGAGAVDQVTSVQAQGETRNYRFSIPVAQELSEEIGGIAVVSMTVLEQYSSYVMQQIVDSAGKPGVWLPVHAPITWGWSIRVGRRGDGEWDILRRKMIRPTVGHEGLQLPEWTTNTLTLKALELKEGA